MASYNFLKQAQVFIVDSSNNQYELEVSNVDFSQTFTENSRKVKTLHTQNMFEASVINKANPADFQIDAFALQQADNKVVFDRLLDYATFDLYIKTEESTFKLEKAVITNGTFLIEQLKPLSISVSGQASKLSRVGNGSYTIPGTVVARSSTITHNQLLHTKVVLGGTDISSRLVSVSLELQNEVSWNPYTTVHGGVAVVADSDTMYPTDFTVSKRILAGNITRFLTDTNSGDIQSWDNNTTLNIKAGNIVSGSLTQGFEFNISNCSYTNRASVATAFTESYDWRMTQNPTSMTDVITYITT